MPNCRALRLDHSLDEDEFHPDAVWTQDSPPERWYDMICKSTSDKEWQWEEFMNDAFLICIKLSGVSKSILSHSDQLASIDQSSPLKLESSPLQKYRLRVPAMPFLSREEFKEWADDGTGNVWQRVNATGAFCGLCYAAGDILRNLRVLRGASSMKYRIITDFTDAENRHIHIEVAQADSEEDFLDLLNRLNSLTVQEVMGAASSDRMEMLEQLIERARNIDVDVANEHKEFLSVEMLQKISRLELAETSLQQKLEEAQKALQNKEAEKQELQDEFCVAMAQQALEQVLRWGEGWDRAIKFDSIHRESPRQFGPVKCFEQHIWWCFQLGSKARGRSRDIQRNWAGSSRCEWQPYWKDPVSPLVTGPRKHRWRDGHANSGA